MAMITLPSTCNTRNHVQVKSLLALASIMLCVTTVQAEERWHSKGSTVTDVQTGLDWKQSDNGSSINWESAMSHCQMEGGGWRLPSSSELERLFDQAFPGVRCGEFKCGVSQAFRLGARGFWTEEQSGDSEAVVVFLDDSPFHVRMPVQTDNVRALCVRKHVEIDETLSEKLMGVVREADKLAGRAIDDYKASNALDEARNYALCVKNMTQSEATVGLSNSSRMQSGSLKFSGENNWGIKAGGYSVILRQTAALNMLAVESENLRIRQKKEVPIETNSTIVIDDNGVNVIADQNCRIST